VAAGHDGQLFPGWLVEPECIPALTVSGSSDKTAFRTTLLSDSAESLVAHYKFQQRLATGGCEADNSAILRAGVGTLRQRLRLWTGNLRMKLLMQCLLALWICMIPDLASAQAPADVGALLQKINRVIREAVGIDPPGNAVAQDLEGPNKRLPLEKDVDDLRTRLQGYSHAMQAWIVHVCQLSEEQHAQLKDVFDAQVAADVKEFSERKLPENGQQYFPAGFPMVFTITFAEERGPAVAVEFTSHIVAVLQKSVLTGEQSERLAAALQERESFQTQAFIGSLVAIIDDELFLTQVQRERLHEKLTQQKPAIVHPFYVFQPQAYYLPYKSLAGVVSINSDRSFLDHVQKKRWQDLDGADPNSQHVIFQASSGIDGWHQQMKDVGLKQREKFLHAAAVRVAWLEKELHLSGEQVEYLNTASKGAAVRAVGDWKETTQQMFEQMEQQMAAMRGDFAFGAQNIDTRSLEKNEVWTDAVKTVIGADRDQSTAERRAVIRTANARCVLALLDDEIWLLPEQREPMLSLVEKSRSEDAAAFQYQEYIRHVIMIAFPLLKSDEAERNKILTEPQREVWKQMQSFFLLQKQNNYVQIQLRNNGGSFGFMLQ